MNLEVAKKPQVSYNYLACSATYWMAFTQNQVDARSAGVIISATTPSGRSRMDNQAKEVARAHVYISGRVHGVGFRYSTMQMAQLLDLTGWVRNLWDGRVEAVFEGPADKVEQAVAWCWRGPRPARVEHVEVSAEAPTGEFKFFRVAG